MSESRPKKRKIEFIESYWTGGKHGSDYIWNDNHGELVRCRDCMHSKSYAHGGLYGCVLMDGLRDGNWYCADGEREDSE